MIEPAPATDPEIIKIVNELNPRGMTPMTDAVIAAAQALRHTEQAATAILVSDGIETCNPDPCAAARALEQAGVDFTTHVIGFDISGEAEALMQMQCIAAETGGRFLTADNAQELSEALQQVVAAPLSGTLPSRQILPCRRSVTVHSEAHDDFSQTEDVFASDSIPDMHVLFPPALPTLPSSR